MKAATISTIGNQARASTAGDETTASGHEATAWHALAADDAGIPDEPQAGQGTSQAASGPVETPVPQAGTSGAGAQAQTEAATGQPADAGESQPASEHSAVAEFWDRYYGSFHPFGTKMAAITSAQLF